MTLSKVSANDDCYHSHCSITARNERHNVRPTLNCLLCNQATLKSSDVLGRIHLSEHSKWRWDLVLEIASHSPAIFAVLAVVSRKCSHQCYVRGEAVVPEDAQVVSEWLRSNCCFLLERFECSQEPAHWRKTCTSQLPTEERSVGKCQSVPRRDKLQHEWIWMNRCSSLPPSVSLIVMCCQHCTIDRIHIRIEIRRFWCSCCC